MLFIKTHETLNYYRIEVFIESWTQDLDHRYVHPVLLTSDPNLIGTQIIFNWKDKPYTNYLNGDIFNWKD